MSKLKKVASEKDKTVLRHEDGHEIHLQHSKLPKEQLKSLLKLPMAEGGPVMAQTMDKGPHIDPKKAREMQQGASESGWQPDKWKKNLKEGLGYAQGGKVEKKPLEADELEKTKDPVHYEPIENAPEQEDHSKVKFEKFKDGGDVAAPEASKAPAPSMASELGQAVGTAIKSAMGDTADAVKTVAQPIMDAGKGFVSGVMPKQEVPAAQPAAPQTEAAAPQSSTPAAAVVHPAGVPEASPGLAPQAATQPGVDQQAAQPAEKVPNLYDAYQQQSQAIKGMGDEQSKLAKNQENIYKSQITAQQDLMNQFKAHSDQLANDRKSLMDDIKNSHIDPNRYLGSMDTGRRIMTSIGLALSGMGNNPTQVSDFLNKQIDRDIEAQKAELGKKQTLLDANFKEYGNMKDAMAMTRIQMMDIANDRMQAAAAKSNSAEAKLKAQQIGGQLDQGASQAMQQMAMNRMLMSGGQGSTDEHGIPSDQYMNALRVMKPEMAKDLEGRIVPGVGVAKIPVPNDSRQTMIAKQTLAQQAQDFYDWAKKHSGDLSPESINTGKTKAAELQSLYRNAINGGVFKKGEQDFIDQIIDSDPTKFFNNIRVLPKLKEVMDSNNKQLNILKKAYQLPESDGKPQLNGQQQAFAKWAQSNINSKDADTRKKAQMTLKKLGLDQ